MHPDNEGCTRAGTPPPRHQSLTPLPNTSRYFWQSGEILDFLDAMAVSQPVNQTLSQLWTSWYFDCVTPNLPMSEVSNFNYCSLLILANECDSLLDKAHVFNFNGQWRMHWIFLWLLQTLLLARQPSTWTLALPYQPILSLLCPIVGQFYQYVHHAELIRHNCFLCLSFLFSKFCKYQHMGWNPKDM